MHIKVPVDRTPIWYTSVDPDVSENLFVSFPYIFQAKYIRNKKINENKLVGGATTWGTIWGSCLRAPVEISLYLAFANELKVSQKEKNIDK